MLLKEKLTRLKVSENKIKSLLVELKEQLKEKEIIRLANVSVKKGKNLVIVEIYGYNKRNSQVFITNWVKIKWFWASLIGYKIS